MASVLARLILYPGSTAPKNPILRERLEEIGSESFNSIAIGYLGIGFNCSKVGTRELDPELPPKWVMAEPY